MTAHTSYTLCNVRYVSAVYGSEESLSMYLAEYFIHHHSIGSITGSLEAVNHWLTCVRIRYGGGEYRLMYKG